MTDLFREPEGATQLSPEERRALRQTWITYRADLNKAEELNVRAGAAWARRRKRKDPADILNDEYAKALHKRMFGDVWKWAGKYRQRKTNLGIEPHLISTAVPMLFDDVRYWLENNTYGPDELATRLHHRLVQIHPFPNGNGRHTRLMADLLVERLGQKPFTWGRGNLAEAGELRTKYKRALEDADDRHDIKPLLRFARS